MLLDALRLTLAVAFLVVAPGLLAVQAAFPPGRSDLRRIERAYLALASGIGLLILVGVTLGSLPHGRRGSFQTIATGFPNVELVMTAVCVVLFYVGLARGAYPRLAARYPRLVRPEGRATRP